MSTSDRDRHSNTRDPPSKRARISTEKDILGSSTTNDPLLLALQHVAAEERDTVAELCWQIEELSLPRDIGQFTELWRLEIDVRNSNKYLSLPQQIGQLKNLRSLACKILRELPHPALRLLIKLETLMLSSSQLREYPPSISDLKALKDLSLSSCEHLKHPPPGRLGFSRIRGISQ